LTHPDPGRALHGTKTRDLATGVVELATRAGASSAEVLIREGSEFTSSVRLGTLEKLLQSSFRKLGVRLFAGRRAAVAATSDYSAETLEQLVSDTLAMARIAGEDPCAGLPDRECYEVQAPLLTLDFSGSCPQAADAKVALARRCESSSLDYDPRITNSEGATFSNSLLEYTYANSLGVCFSYAKTLNTLQTVPLAEIDGHKQRDFWYSSHLDFARLSTPEAIGSEAARRTVRRLGARQVRTTEVPVVFDPLSAASLLRNLSDAVSGTAVLRKASFLMDHLNQRVAPSSVSIFDDGRRPDGLGSRPFDSEGVPPQITPVIAEGILTGYLLDSYTARKLGMRTTGNSSREPGGAPAVGPSNFYLAAGDVSPEAIIGSVKTGLYVTDLIGFGVNTVSGDYSQGASGIWIENGEFVFPVEEITIAGNLKEMLKGIEAVGNDLTPMGEVFSPTVKISRMVVSGS